MKAENIYSVLVSIVFAAFIGKKSLKKSLKSRRFHFSKCVCVKKQNINIGLRHTPTQAAIRMFLIAVHFDVWLLHWKMLKVVKTVGIVQGAKAGKHWAFLIFSQCFFVWRERLVVSRAVFHKNRAQKRCSSQVYKKTRSGKTLAFDFRFVAGKPPIGENWKPRILLVENTQNFRRPSGALCLRRFAAAFVILK